MGILDYLGEARHNIGIFLNGYMESKFDSLKSVDDMGAEAARKLLDFALRGKMIRGALVSLGTLAGGGGTEMSAYAAGGAMELIQSGLLIHDDIMDRDLTRRGAPSVFSQYIDKAKKDGITDAYHLGEALGICVGDIAYFMAFEIIASLDARPDLCKRVAQMTSSELSLVGSAQMLDMYWSAKTGARAEEEVYRLYLYKTGRYTFTLPLAAGAILGEADDEKIEALSAIGENLGIVFQIKDDELGLMGDEDEIGKPVGSDIRESKKTIFYSLLAARTTGADRARLDGVFGNKDATDDDIRFVQNLVGSLGIIDETEAKVSQLNAQTNQLITNLNATEAAKELLMDLMKYNTTRKT